MPDIDTDSTMILERDPNDGTKTLGVLWLPAADVFKLSIKTDLDRSQVITKRTILSQIFKLFDFLGLLGSVTVKAKILQKLWQCKLV